MKRLNKLVLAAAALTAALALAGCDNGSPSSSSGGGSSYDPWPSRAEAMQKEVAEMRSTQATEQNRTPMSMAKKALNIAETANSYKGSPRDAEFEMRAMEAAEIAYKEAIAEGVFQYEDGEINNTDVTTALTGSPALEEIKSLLASAKEALPKQAEDASSTSNQIMLRNEIPANDKFAGKSLIERALSAINDIIKALELTKKDIGTNDLAGTLTEIGLSLATLGDNNPFTPLDTVCDSGNPKISKGYTYLFDKTKNYLVLEAKNLKAHVNGAGNVGYWLGFNFDDKKYKDYTVGWGYGATVKGTTPLASTTCYFDYDTVSKRDEARDAPDSKPCVYFVADDGMGTTKQLVVSFDVTKKDEVKDVTNSGIEKATLADNNDLPGAKITDVDTLQDPALSYNYKDPTTYYIKLATNDGNKLKAHINDQGNVGYWVGVKIPVGKWLNKDTDTIEIDGKPYPVQSNLDADGQNFSIYWDAKKYSEGKTAEFKIKTKKPYQLGNPIDKTFTFVVDMSKVTLDDTQYDISSIPFETAKLGDNNQFNKNDNLHDDKTYELKQMSYRHEDPTIYTITLRADNLKKHKNANQVNGYWVGIKIPVGQWLNKDTDTIVIDGKPYTMAEALDADGTGVSIYWDYGKKKDTGDAYFIVKRGANAKPKEYRVNVDFEVKKADAKIEIGSDENGIKTKTGIEKATIADKNPVTPITDPVNTSEYKLSDMYYNDDDPTEYFVTLTAKDLKAHVNGAGTVGYWVGIALDNAKDVWKLLPNDKLEYGIKGETPKTINSVSGNSNIYWDVAKVLVVTSDPKPTAYFEVTRGGKKLYRLNVELDVTKDTAKENDVTTSAQSEFTKATLGDNGGSASDTNKIEKVHKSDETYKVSEIKYDYANPKQYNVKLEIDSLRRHFNGEHNPGYWVGVDLKGKWAADGDTLVSVNRAAKNVQIDGTGLQFYWDAGKSTEQTIKIRKGKDNAFGISNYEYEIVVTVDLKGGESSTTLQHPAITDFATAPLVDQAGYFGDGKPNGDLHAKDSYNVKDARYDGNDPTKYRVSLEVKDLVSHTNGAKQKGWWVGIKLPKEWISKGDSFGKADGEKTNIALDRKVTELDKDEKGEQCFTVYWNLLNTEKADNKGTFVFQHQGKRYTIIVDFSDCTRK